MQGIEYSYDSIFAEFEPLLYPNLLALASEIYGQDEMYRMLVATGPDLCSIMNKNVVLKERIESNSVLIAIRKADHESQVAALTARHLSEISALADENQQLEKELEEIELEETHRSLSGKKRRRC